MALFSLQYYKLFYLFFFIIMSFNDCVLELIEL